MEITVSTIDDAYARRRPQLGAGIMFADDIRRALLGTPRGRLAELAAAVWKGFGCGALQENEAQQLAEEIHARKLVPEKPAEPRRRVGSRPRSPNAMGLRRRLTSSGWLPPQLATRFTMAEAAVLATIATEVAHRGQCRLTIGHIAARAGVSRSTVKTAVREAAALGILTSEEWRLTAWRSAPNTIRIVSAEWRTWLRMRDRKRAEADHPQQAEQGGGVKSSATLRSTSIFLTKRDWRRVEGRAISMSEKPKNSIRSTGSNLRDLKARNGMGQVSP